ncbi:MAG: hypothetical protein ACR2OV_11720, partial [Hyphomicrobiaceae bacterium]
LSLVEARLQSHVAAQWLARAARAYIAPKPDYSHTSLSWDQEVGGLCTQPVEPYGTRIALSLSPLTIEFRGRIHDRLELHGKNESDVGIWLKQALGKCDVDGGALDQYYPDELIGHAIQQGGGYNETQLEAARHEISNWYANAALVLSAVETRCRQIRPGPSPVRCWPHHFDMATLIALDDGDPERARSIGVGLSPGDLSYAEPYYYVTPWPYPTESQLPSLGPLGRWHRDGFVAAIASADRIVATDQQHRAVDEFLKRAVGACMEVLSFEPS